MSSIKNNAILLISCPDKKGIVTSVTNFIFKNQGNILELEQHVDKENKKFFMRVEWEMQDFIIKPNDLSNIFKLEIANPYNMTFQINFTQKPHRMALFVSKYAHCFLDVLSRYQSKDWSIEIPIVISNHLDWKKVVENSGIEFYFSEVKPDNKLLQEKIQLDLLNKHKIDFIVLARYMQILSPQFINQYPNKIINIHHSFLPAFPGAKPYHSAYERGVKIIGATSHYVTEDLDAGPIIEQEVTHVSHNDSVEDLIRKGKDVEKIVLSKAIYKHLNHKVLVHNNRTIVFT